MHEFKKGRASITSTAPFRAAAWLRAPFARPCDRLIPALFVCLLQSLHKIALQSSARLLRPFSKSPSTIPLPFSALLWGQWSFGVFVKNARIVLKNELTS